MEHASFNPAHTTPCHPATTMHCNSILTSPRPVHHHLTFTSDSSESDLGPDSTSKSSDGEEDFQTVPIDNEHWTTEMVPEHFAYMKNGLPNNVMSIPMPLWE